MRRVTDIGLLRPGDRIVRIGRYGDVEIREFLCPHPHSGDRAIFLDGNGYPMMLSAGPDIRSEHWYRFDPDRWGDVYRMAVEHHVREIGRIKKQIEVMEDKVYSERDCSDCAYFRNGPEYDYCSLNGGQAECYDPACEGFEETE